MGENEVKLVAGWDHDVTRCRNSCASHDMEAVPAAGQLLARHDIDAVVIAAETSMHADLVDEAARARKAIVLQKPLALTMEQADRIVHAVGAAGVPFTLAWQMRVDPQNLRMRELVAEGTLGRIVMVRRHHCLATHVWPDFDSSWHVNPELNRGIWADDAAHPIDFMYWMLGEPVSVTAEIDTLLNPKIPDDQGIAVFRYADGCFAEVCCSFTCVAGENTTEIIGERGVVIQNYGDGPSCGVPRMPGAPGLKWFLHGRPDWIDSAIPSPPGHGDRIAGLAEPLLHFLQGRRPAVATAEEGRASLRMTLACYESARTGRRVFIQDL